MYKLCFYVPENVADMVKTAVFEAGAGKMGDYDSCCWQTLGTGQFRPLDNSQPYIGQKGQFETITELKVELVCDDQYIKAAVAALKKAHPYEEPAFDVWKLEDF